MDSPIVSPTLTLQNMPIFLTLEKESGMQSLNTNIPSTSSAPLTRRIIYDRLHFLLQHLLTLIPTLSSTLRPMLIRHFPHKRQNQLSQITYIRNLLRLSDYCPELAETLLASIVDRAIQIDVSRPSFSLSNFH